MNLADCEPIRRRREARERAELLIQQKGAEVCATFTPGERTLVRLGVLPHGKTVEAELELLVNRERDFPMFAASDIVRLLAVAIMGAANAGPDKMVV